jgi:cellulose synthase/poly-beta-1,6-N-acetylglucosamine synthase-like glycosyltransferase
VTAALLFWSGLAVVLASYVGYAGWVAWRARVRPRPVQVRYAADDELPAVTCVMAAADEAATIERKLRILDAQDYPREKVRVLVVSDASTDGTDQIVARRAERDGRVRLLRTPVRGGKPTALNLARGFIDTEVAVLMDVRQDLTPRALRELVAHLSDPAVAVVSGDYRARGDGYWACERAIRRCESRSGSMVQVTGSLYALRTRDLPWIPPATILDDVYVPLSVALRGGRIVMAEEAGSLDSAPRSIGGEFVRKVRTLAGLVQLCHMLPACLLPGRNPVWGRFVAHKLLRLLCPHALLAMLAGGALASGWTFRAAVAGGVAMAVCALGGWLGVRWRVTRLGQSFLALNAAALWAVPAYYLGHASVTWTRVEKERT